MTEEIDEKIKELEQAHLDFISTVSHELRTPLTSIRGFADTLLTSFDKLSPEQRVKFLNIIKEQSNRLINLVENLLTVSKLQSDKEVLVYKEVDILPFVEMVVQVIKSQYKSHRLKIFHDKKLSYVLIDTDKFQQVMVNLLDNACKYSEEGSLVEISLKQEKSKEAVVIEIRDNGVGVSEEYVEKIFNKFSRIDSPLTRKIQGTGLGLYITKNIVEKMNGHISVIPQEVGTIFSVSFPISKYGENTLKKIKEKKC
ncbi:MAG: ATP-binding protein [Candidatus Gastranaerophilales bacterium]|nr:ATP-binding protein [Candidatus Gastranaerophilales bacterium]